jgi:hypothetical protein
MSARSKHPEIPCATLSWCPECGGGDVRLVAGFIAADRVIQLDALGDWIADLQAIYAALLTNNPKWHAVRWGDGSTYEQEADTDA